MKAHKLPSGAVLEVKPLSFEEAWEISRVLVDKIGEMPVDSVKGLDFANLMLTDALILKGPICSLLSSKEVMAAAKKCLFGKCLRDDIKVDATTFEDVTARGDFLPACFFALKENVSPFFDGIASLLMTQK